MAKARALDRRRKSVKNIRKITRTMELIATARFKKAMDRSVAARDYTKQLVKILENIASVGADARPSTRVVLLKGNDARGLVWFSNYRSRNRRSTSSPICDSITKTCASSWENCRTLVRPDSTPEASLRWSGVCSWRRSGRSRRGSLPILLLGVAAAAERRLERRESAGIRRASARA